ncbi:MAG TPA: type II toxin-antitoxin system HicA family toxin [Candidatus Paceibacterota bacterium]
MPKLPRLRAKDLIKILLKEGFVFSRQKGSHRIFKSLDGKRRVVVPIHDNEILHPKLIKDAYKILNQGH